MSNVNNYLSRIVVLFQVRSILPKANTKFNIEQFSGKAIFVSTIFFNNYGMKSIERTLYIVT